MHHSDCSPVKAVFKSAHAYFKTKWILGRYRFLNAYCYCAGINIPHRHAPHDSANLCQAAWVTHAFLTENGGQHGSMENILSMMAEMEFKLGDEFSSYEQLSCAVKALHRHQLLG